MDGHTAKQSSSEAPRRFDVFISYARNPDEAFVARLYADLLQAGVRVWWDRQAMESRGRSFLQELRDGIESSERLLFVVGPGSLASSYCRAELTHGLLFAKAALPLLRDGDFARLPSEFNNLDGVDFRPSRVYQEALTELLRKLAEPVAPLGRLRNLVPRLPPHFIARRTKFDELIGHVLADLNRPVAVGPAKQVTALYGLPGTGKSVLAAAFARAADVRRAFEDGVVWMPVGQTPDTHTLLRQIGLALGGDQLRFDRPEDARRNLPELLTDKVCFIVLDDVWQIRAIDAVLDAASVHPQCRILLTTRDFGLVTRLGANQVSLDELGESDALHLMADWARTPVDRLPAEAREAARACGFLPLALAMVAASIHGRPERWRHQLERLRSLDLERIKQELPGYPYPTLAHAIEVSVDALDTRDGIEASARQHYSDIAVFPRGLPIPGSALEVLWAANGISQSDVDDVLTLFVERSLARRDDMGRLTLHDLQTDYVTRKAGDLKQLHVKLLNAYRGRMTSGDWASMPSEEPYLWDQLAYHLSHAGLPDQLRAVASDVAYLGTKAYLRGAHSCIQDIDIAIRHAPGNRDLLIVKQVIQQHIHLLTRARTARCSIATLTSRLAAHGRLAALCASARQRQIPPYVFPTWPLPDQADPALVLSREVDSECNFGPIAVGARNGSIVVGGGYDGSVAVFDVSTGRHMALQTGHTTGVKCLVFDREGHRLAAGGNNGQITLWSTEGWQHQRTLSFEDCPVYCLAFNLSGLLLASGHANGQVCIWDLTNEGGAPVSSFQAHDGGPDSAARDPYWSSLTAIAFDDTGGRLATGNTRGLVTVIEWPSTTTICAAQSAGYVRALRFSAAERLVVGTQAALRSGSQLLSIPICQWVDSSYRYVDDDGSGLWGGYAMDATGDRFAVSVGYGPIFVLDTRTGEQVAALRGNPRGAGALAFFPQGNWLSSVCTGVLRTWNCEMAVRELPKINHRGYVRAVDFDPSGTKLASADDDTVRVWDVGDHLKPRQTFFANQVIELARFDGSGDRLIIDWNGLSEWSLASEIPRPLTPATPGSKLQSQLWHAVAARAAPRIAAIRGTDTPLRVVDLDSQAVLGELSLPVSEDAVLALSADGKLVAVSGRGSKLSFWEWASSTASRVLEAVAPMCRGNARSLTFDPGGVLVAMGFSDGDLAVIAVEDGRTLWENKGHHTGGVGALAIDHTGRLLASGDEEGLLCIWDTRLGSLLAELCLDGWFYEVSWHPSGSSLAVAGAGGLYVLEYVTSHT
jgi:WD40 repeat protein